jgi:peptide/nickel transport system ATP-binding protein
LKSTPILSVKNLAVEFKTAKGNLRAVSDVSFDISAGDTLGIVGESGCGKSVTALAILGLIPAPHGKIVRGSITFKGQELVGLSESKYRSIRGRDISMIFQEPMTALNPVFRIGSQMVNVLCRHQSLSRKQARARAIEMLKAVGIPSPENRIDDYPHQLSGGMRQRVMIAMALSCGPSLLLADEPTTALDVTTQAQVMYEISKLQKEQHMAMVLVTHDLGVVAESCQNVLVMYCGQVVEAASVKELFRNPRHPYTRGLIASIPVVREKKLARLPTIEGMVPDLLDLPPGCRFVDRCERAVDRCRVSNPPLLAEGGAAFVACFAPYGRNEQA